MNQLAVYNTKIFSKNYIEMMLNGEKTIDIKLSTQKIAPYEKLHKNDWIYLKESGGPVVGRVQVAEVENIDLEMKEPQHLFNILSKIIKEVGLKDESHAKNMYEKKKHCRYVCLFKLKNPQRIQNSVKIYKNDRRVWVPDYKLPLELEVLFGSDIGLNRHFVWVKTV